MNDESEKVGKRDWKSLAWFALAGAGFVAGLVGGFALAGVNELTLDLGKTLLLICFAGSLLAFSVWTIYNLFHKKMPSLSRKLEEANELARNLEKQLNTVTGIASLRQITYYNDQTNQVLGDFVKNKALLSADVRDIRIVATFLGVTEETYNLGKHFEAYFQNRKDEGLVGSPFRNLNLAVPSSPNSVNAVRRFVVSIFESIHEIFGGNCGKSTVTIKFMNSEDVFPCWHLWGNIALIIIPSIGANDSDLSKKLPVAIAGFIKDHRLQATNNRLVEHFDEDIMKEGSHVQEKWTLMAEGKVSILLCDSITDSDETFRECLVQKSTEDRLSPRKRIIKIKQLKKILNEKKLAGVGNSAIG